MSHRSGKCPQRAVIGSRLSDSSHWTPEEEEGGGGGGSPALSGLDGSLQVPHPGVAAAALLQGQTTSPPGADRYALASSTPDASLTWKRRSTSALETSPNS